MEQPPGECKVFAVRLEIVAVNVVVVVVIVVLERDLRGELRRGWFAGWRSERDYRGEVGAAAKQVELDACQESEEGEGVE